MFHTYECIEKNSLDVSQCLLWWRLMITAAATSPGQVCDLLQSSHHQCRDLATPAFIDEDTE